MDPLYRVVIVDDVADLRLLMRLALEPSGRFAVIGEGGTGVDAVDLARELRPDLMLLDVSMPAMDGLEALPLIRSVSPETKVVVVSGFAEMRLGRQVEELGAIGYVEKGFAAGRLADHLVDLLGERPLSGTSGCR